MTNSNYKISSVYTIFVVNIHSALMENSELQSIENINGYENELPGSIKGGFSSPIEDKREKLDLLKLLVRHKASTFFFRVSGLSMTDTGMNEGDIIIVDRAVDPYDNCKAVCCIDGEYTVKRVSISEKEIRLVPVSENDNVHKPIEFSPDNNLTIWGVVTWVIKKM